MKTITYYAVCNAGGPISVMLDGATEEQAVEAFAQLDGRQAIDDARTDLEDELEISGEGMSEDDFGDALTAKGAEHVRSLEPIHGHRETGHLKDGWSLWRVLEGAYVWRAEDLLDAARQSTTNVMASLDCVDAEEDAEDAVAELWRFHEEDEGADMYPADLALSQREEYREHCLKFWAEHIQRRHAIKVEFREEHLGDEAPSDLNAYVALDVTVSGTTYRVGAMVGAMESDHGTVRASGAGVRPFCTAWWADASDHETVPAALKGRVLDAILKKSLGLYRKAVAAREAADLEVAS